MPSLYSCDRSARGQCITSTSCDRFRVDLVGNLAYVLIIAESDQESTDCVDSVTFTVSSNLEYN